ncbi:MAG: protein kinase [Myxococcales bacterium]|nr:protein kinase [Myxococcales bacterium]
MTELEFIIESPGERRAVAFPSACFVVGSDDSCQLRFTQGLLQPRHAEVVRDLRGQWWIRDLVATGAVVVNGTPVLDERLAAGDKVRIGAVVLTVQDTGVDKKARTISGETPTPGGQPDTAELQTGRVIDKRYRVLGRLAAGGMGEVYRAEHVELGKPLALKVMLPELSEDPDFVGRFKREALAASRIGQHNIVDISDFGRTEDGRFYFVMEYLDGVTLSKAVKRDGPFPAQRVVHVGLQVARALAAAHAQRIIHRDLKPENIMLVQRPGQPDFVKVLDFGIAKVTGNSGSGGFTAIGTVVGTPQYMSPEQAAGVAVDARSDVYALGLIFHELINGRPTFTGDTAPALMAMQLKHEPPPLRSPVGPLPRDLEHLVFHMLKKAPEDRPSSMEAVAHGLESIAAFPTPSARTAPVQPVQAPAVASLAAIQPTGFEAAVKAGSKTDLLVAPRPSPTVPMPPAPAPLSTAPTRLEAGVKTPAPPTSAAPAQSPTPAPASLEDEGAALKPRRWPLVAGLGALFFFGAVLVVALARPQAPQSPPGVVVAPPAPPSMPAPKGPSPLPTPSAVKLTFTSGDVRAEVYEDDVLLGTTPLTLSRPQGTLTTLRFEAKGHEPATRKLRFEADTAVALELEKTRAKGKPAGPRPPRPPSEELKDSPF